MHRMTWAAVLTLSAVGAPATAAERPTQFWNLTAQTVTSLKLSHAGSGAYGENLAVGDPDGVEHDERLRIVGLPSGRYDLELRFKNGRVCFVRGVEIVTGKVFSVEDKTLTACSKT
jgi:hypothetical protein